MSLNRGRNDDENEYDSFNEMNSDVFSDYSGAPSYMNSRMNSILSQAVLGDYRDDEMESDEDGLERKDSYRFGGSRRGDKNNGSSFLSRNNSSVNLVKDKNNEVKRRRADSGVQQKHISQLETSAGSFDVESFGNRSTSSLFSFHSSKNAPLRSFSQNESKDNNKKRHGNVSLTSVDSNNYLPVFKNSSTTASSKQDSRSTYTLNTTEYSSFTNKKKKQVRKVSRLLQEVPFTFVISQIRGRMTSNSNLRDAFIFIIFVVLFCVSTVTRSHPVYAGIETLTQDIFEKSFPNETKQVEHFRQRVGMMDANPWVDPGKTFSSIYHHSEWVSFVSDVVLRYFFPQDQTRKATFKYGFVPIGALRFKMIRVKENSAKIQTDFYPANDTDFPRKSWFDGVSKEHIFHNDSLCPEIKDPKNPNLPLFRYLNCSEDEEGGVYGIANYYPCGSFYFEIPFSSNISAVKAYTAALSDPSCLFVNSWSTRYVAIQFYMFSPSLQTFYRVQYRSEITSSGWAYNHKSQNFFDSLTPNSSLSFLAYFIVVFVYFLFYTGMSIFGFVNLLTHGKKGAIKALQTPMIYVDLGIITSGLCYFIFCFILFSKSYKLAKDDRFVYPFPDEFPSYLEEIYYYSSWKPAAAVCLMFMAVRLLKLCYLWKAFEILLQSIGQIAGIIWVTLFTFSVLLIGYALAGWAMFSNYSEAFETIGESILTLYLLLFASLTFYPINNVNPSIVFLYIFFYYVFILTLGYHMTVAIFSVCFSEKVSKKLMVYDGFWLQHFFTHFFNKFTARRMKAFVKTLFGIHNENKYLSEVCVILEAYVNEQVRLDTIEQQKITASAPRGLSIVSVPGRKPLETVCSPNAKASRRSTEGSLSVPILTPRKLINDTQTPLSLPAERRSSFENSMSTSSKAVTSSERESTPEFEEPEEEVGMRRINRDQYKMSYSQWSELLSTRLYRRCGGQTYFADMWRSIVEALRDFEQTPDQLAAYERRLQTQDLTNQVMSNELTKIERLDATISNLERHVNVLSELVTKHELVRRLEQQQEESFPFNDVDDEEVKTDHGTETETEVDLNETDENMSNVSNDLDNESKPMKEEEEDADTQDTKPESKADSKVDT